MLGFIRHELSCLSLDLGVRWRVGSGVRVARSQQATNRLTRPLSHRRSDLLLQFNLLQHRQPLSDVPGSPPTGTAATTITLNRKPAHHLANARPPTAPPLGWCCSTGSRSAAASPMYSQRLPAVDWGSSRWQKQQELAQMKVGLLGAGPVAETLAAPLLQSGHPVQYASRNPSAPKVKGMLQKLPGSTAGTWADTIAWADALVLLTPGVRQPAEYTALAQQMGPGIKGKVLIDATNPLSAYPVMDVLWNGTSGGELLQEAVPEAHVFKAFNTAGTGILGHADGSTILGDPSSGYTPLDPLSMMYAGPTQQQEVVEAVIRDVGFRPQYVGPIRYARNLEAIAELWIHTALQPAGHSRHAWGPNFHFQVLRNEYEDFET